MFLLAGCAGAAALGVSSSESDAAAADEDEAATDEDEAAADARRLGSM